MKTTWQKYCIFTLMVGLILLLSACSNLLNLKKDSDVNTNNQQIENVVQDEVENDIVDEPITEDDIPPSEFTYKELDINSNYVRTELGIQSRYYFNEIGIESKMDKRVIQALSEFDAVKTDSGTKLSLPEDILFDFNSAKLRSEADDAIEKLAAVADETDGNITIIGHTDSRGDDAHNQKLSEDRAKSVLQALVDEGVKKDRLTSEGKGSTDPIASNTKSDGSDDPDGRQKNRRVEVIVQGME